MNRKFVGMTLVFASMISVAAVAQAQPGDKSSAQVADEPPALNKESTDEEKADSHPQVIQKQEAETKSQQQGTNEQSADAEKAVETASKPAVQPPATQPLKISADRARMGANFVNSSNGVSIVSVYTNSPAYEQGLQSGDHVTTADGKPVNSVRELMEILTVKKAGESVTLAVKRGNDEKSFTTKMVSREELSKLAMDLPARERTEEEQSKGEQTARVEVAKPNLSQATIQYLQERIDQREEELKEMRGRLQQLKKEQKEQAKSEVNAAETR